MKRSKINRALDHLDDELIAGAAKESSRTPVWKRIAALAAAFVLLLGSAVLIANFISLYDPGMIIALDVNPSIEIKVNKKEQVLEANALNEDAKTVLGDMNFKKLDLEVAINAIIGSMLSHGYLSADQNSILISVSSKDAQKAELIKASISSKVSAILGEKNIEASVITQDYTTKEETHEGVSAAVSALIEKIISTGLTNSNGVPYTYDELAGLRVNELKLILESKDVTPEGVSSSGQANEGKYIGKQAALALALTKAGLTEESVREISVELDFDSKTKVMLYEIEFETAENEYEYEINAVSGEILKEEKESSDDHISADPVAPEALISKADALALALADSSLSADAVRDVDCDLHNKNFYTVEFETADTEYEYKIDAVSGSIINKKTEPQKKEEQGDVTTPATVISKEAALSSALADASLTENAISELEIEFENENGKPEYDIEFRSGLKEYEYKIDALTGDILKKKIHTHEDDRDDDDDVPPPTSTVTRESAIAAALADAGLAESSVRELECEFDRDDGSQVWEVKFESGKKEYSYKIDALTGKILEREIDD